MPLEGTFTKFNWVDILVICVVLLISYRGSLTKLFSEVLKILGTIVSFCLALHYFSKLSDFLIKYFPDIEVVVSDMISFMLLALLSYWAVALVREVFTRFIKVEAIGTLDKWGGLVLGFIRGVLVTSLVLIVLYLPSVSYLKGSVKKSYLGSQLVMTDIQIYGFLMNGLVSKLAPGEVVNRAIYEVFTE